MLRLVRLLLLPLLLVPTARAEDFERELAAWRAERVARLTAPDGWLSLIGLHWLREGEQTVGSAEGNDLRLAAGPAQLGTVTLLDGRSVHFRPTPGVDARVNDLNIEATKTGDTVLRYESPGPATVVRVGELSFFVIQRGDKLALRVRDNDSPRRRDFAGIGYFDADPAWRIEADWVPFETPREIPITNLLGQTSPAKVPGKAVFTHEGRTIELLPLADSADETLFFILSDATSGVETYEAARFLYAAPPRDGKVILDFNRAQNPPCAFTPFATCPLPPRENRLKLRITAGEKAGSGEH
jgi:uncharacterized protein